FTAQSLFARNFTSPSTRLTTTLHRSGFVEDFIMVVSLSQPPGVASPMIPMLSNSTSSVKLYSPLKESKRISYLPACATGIFGPLGVPTPEGKSSAPQFLSQDPVVLNLTSP